VGVRIKAPDQERLEFDVHQCFQHGEITDVAKEARVNYDVLRKQLSPNAIEESPAYQFLFFLYAAFKVRPELAEEIWNVVGRHRPQRDERPASANALDAAWFDYKAVLARREDGLAFEDEVERARNVLIETVARSGRPARSGTEGAS
jgi:hypothetical protein